MNHRAETGREMGADAAAGAAASPTHPGYRLLSDAQLEQIHCASLEILRRTGTRVFDQETVTLLADAGCVVSDGTLVRFPAAVVEEALLHAPSRVLLCDRTGAPRVHLEGHRSYFGTGSDLPNTLDLETGERRLSRLADVKNTARLVDALPNLDFAMTMALPSDVPAKTSDRRAFLAMIENTVKPVLVTTWDEGGLVDLIAMAAAVAGSPAELRLKPFLLAYLEPSSPLQHSEPVLHKMRLMAEHGLPFVYAPGSMQGGTAPVTAAGSLAMANAEVLSGLVIAQLWRKGTPFVYGSGCGPLDMRTMVSVYAAPEFMRHSMATAELAHCLYHLPVWGFSGCTDAKLPDIQAGIESALWILCMALSGANLVHDVGYVESGLTCSYELIVVSDEIISFVRQLLGDMSLAPEALALDTIDQVGPGGTFLTTPHTRRNFRQIWYPRILDRRMYGDWKRAGQTTATERAREFARETLSTHQVIPLPANTLAELRAIASEANARAGLPAPEWCAGGA